MLKDVEASPGIVLYTIFNRELADQLEQSCKRLNLPCVAALQTILKVFESYLGTPSTPEALTAIGDKGVLALVCDSTNAFNTESSGSEGSVHADLLASVKAAKGRVVVTSFASNAARLAARRRPGRQSGVGRDPWRRAAWPTPATRRGSCAAATLRRA